MENEEFMGRYKRVGRVVVVEASGFVGVNVCIGRDNEEKMCFTSMRRRYGVGAGAWSGGRERYEV